ncbi:MAG: YaiI/YqxD family protein, partial [Gammaproteobacteria bacterium]|nr:YaiI/YqxD family protein [Gammaproteobacteria bacterium]
THENVRELLMMRNAREAMRDSGEIRGGPPPFNAKDVQKFAQALDRVLARRGR